MTHATKGGLHLTKLMLKHRDIARDVVLKTCVPLGFHAWDLFGDTEALPAVAACPKYLAEVLGSNCLKVPLETSRALNALPRAQIIEELISTCRTEYPDYFMDWFTFRDCGPVWWLVVSDIKVIIRTNEGRLSSDALKECLKVYFPKFLQRGSPALWLKAAKEASVDATSAVSHSN